uniref:Uncharacterized protein n=1 Tax=Caulobacter phage BL57 TaxID=3348355 RepID=A0AB74UGQ0_9VIRU
MSLFGIIALAWKFFLNPAVMGVVFAAIAALSGLWFLGGPALFWKVIRDARLWLLVAVASVVFGYGHLQAKLEQTEKRLEQVENQKRSHDDGQEVVKNNIKKQVRRAKQAAKYQEVIHDARLAKSSTRSSTSSRASKAFLIPALLTLSLTLAACQSVPVGFSPDDLYPKELRTCTADPKVPLRPAPALPRAEDDQTGYVKNLKLAAADCRDKVESWNERAVKYEAQYKDMNASPVSKLFGRLKGKKQ